MRRRQVFLWTEVVMLLVLSIVCGNCDAQGQRKVESVRSYFAALQQDAESVLQRHARSGHRSRRAVLNSMQSQQVINDHNRVRRLVGASDMQILSWSDDLAMTADGWAQQCNYAHSTGLGQLGQNIYASSSFQSINVTDAVQRWYDENLYYNYDTGACSVAECGHYTQVVWSTTHQVGCASMNCPSLINWPNGTAALILVCNYRPGGNYVGVKPFQIGTGCSRCLSRSWFCTEGLCDPSCTAVNSPSMTCGCAPVCLNLASVTVANCSCSCAPGWDGSDCSIVCQDHDTRCNPQAGQYGFPPYYCNFNNDTSVTVRDLCPKMCGVCQAANNDSPTTKPALLSLLLSLWLSWLLIYSFHSI